MSLFLPPTKTSCPEPRAPGPLLSPARAPGRCPCQSGSCWEKAGFQGGVSFAWAEMIAMVKGPGMFCSVASSCFCRLCWVQRGNQAWPVAPCAGQAMARQLLQMPDLQRHPHRGVHQQVGVSSIPPPWLPGPPHPTGLPQGVLA